MQIVKVSQSEDRQIWLEKRLGVVTGTKAKTVAPPKRGTATPQGIYELLAEKVAVPSDGELARDRGLRVENDGIQLTAEKYDLDLDTDPGMWLTDDGKLGVSPDASERSQKPTYAAENKSLDTKNHLQVILNDYAAKQLPGYNPLDSLKVSTSDFAPQAIQYFVVNEYLETLYFSVHDDRVALDNVVHYVIVIKREHVQEYVDGQEAYERDALARVDDMIATLKGINL